MRSFDEQVVAEASPADLEPALVDRFRTPRSERLSGRRPVYELPDESELKLTILAADGGADGSPA